MVNILIFSALQLINVIFSTIKAIVQIRGSKLAAMLVNSFYYAFYTIVVVFMVAQFVEDPTLNLIIKMAITFGTNLVGTYISMTLIEHFRKDKLWKIDLTVNTSDAEEIHEKLRNIPHSFIVITDKKTVFTFYCATGKDSTAVKEICDSYNAKYFVSENKISL